MWAKYGFCPTMQLTDLQGLSWRGSWTLESLGLWFTAAAVGPARNMIGKHAGFQVEMQFVSLGRSKRFGRLHDRWSANQDVEGSLNLQPPDCARIGCDFKRISARVASTPGGALELGRRMGRRRQEYQDQQHICARQNVRDNRFAGQRHNLYCTRFVGDARRFTLLLATAFSRR